MDELSRRLLSERKYVKGSLERLSTERQPGISDSFVVLERLSTERQPGISDRLGDYTHSLKIVVGKSIVRLRIFRLAE